MKSPIIDIINHFDEFIATLPYGFMLDSVRVESDGSIEVRLEAKSISALHTLSSKIHLGLGMERDTLTHSVGGNIDAGNVSYSVVAEYHEPFDPVVYAGVVCSDYFPTHIWMNVYDEAKRRQYLQTGTGRYTFHVHPAHTDAFMEWAAVHGQDVQLVSESRE